MFYLLWQGIVRLVVEAVHRDVVVLQPEWCEAAGGWGARVTESNLDS